MIVELKPWAEPHIPALTRHANNKKIADKLRDNFPHPYTAEDARLWILANRPLHPITNFAVLVDGEAAGGVGMVFKNDIYRKTVEIGYWVAEPFWGRGVASMAVRQLINHIKRDFDFVRIYAEVFSNNPASMRVLEKNNFHREAILEKAIYKNNNLLDAHVWALILTGQDQS